MRTFIFLLFASFSLISCQKKYTYQCETVYQNQASGSHNYITKTMTEKQKDNYVSDNTKNIDGSDDTFTIGEYYTNCTKK